MSSIHILTHARRIENNDVRNKVYKVITPQTEQIFQDERQALQTHTFKLECKRIDIEVVLPEIHDREKIPIEGYLIVPEFLIPRRPYTIYVYLYAILTYCLNPVMGQREAAKRTRERFGLKTFSHTTLGRAMKKLEKLINEYDGESVETQDPDSESESADEKFPSVAQTKDRRKTVAAYLMKAAGGDASLTEEASQQRKQPDYRKPPYTGAFIDACHNIVGYTFLNYHRLLL